jgi:hypothetical protein
MGGSITTDISVAVPDGRDKTALAVVKQKARPFIVDLVGRGNTRLEIRDQLIEKFGVTKFVADNMVLTALREMVITTVDGAERDTHLTLAIARLSTIFKDAVACGDLKVALDANKQICQLQGLFADPEPGPRGNRGSSPSVPSKPAQAANLSDDELRNQLPADTIEAEYEVKFTTVDEVDELLAKEAAE